MTEAGKLDPHLDITCEWNVADVDGNLDTVLVDVENSKGRLLDAGFTDVTGSSATMSNRIKIKHQEGKTVDVVLTVFDTFGNSSSQTRTITE